MPRSAAASAGASLIPSPTIATRLPRACSAATSAALLGRPHAGVDARDPDLARDRARDRLAIAGDHHDLDAELAKRRDRLGRTGGDRIRDRDRAGERAVDRDVGHGGTLRDRGPRGRPGGGLAVERAGLDPAEHEELLGSHEHLAPGDRGGDPAARRRGHLRGAVEREAAIPRRLDDRARERMLAPLLGRRDDAQQVVLGPPDRIDADDLRRSRGQRAGLVEQRRPRSCSRPRARSPPRNRTPSSAPRDVPTATAAGVASPSAHGHAITSTAIIRASARRSSAPASHQPTNVGDRDREHHRDEPRRDAVGEPRDRRLAALRILDGARDPRERGLGAGPRDAHDERAVVVERAGVDRRALGPCRPAGPRR